MKNLPEKIYLQFDKDSSDEQNFNNHSHEHITWCVDRINETDAEYVLASSVHQQGEINLEEVEKLVKKYSIMFLDNLDAKLANSTDINAFRASYRSRIGYTLVDGKPVVKN